jgi:hypothetical protein
LWLDYMGLGTPGHLLGGQNISFALWVGAIGVLAGCLGSNSLAPVSSIPSPRFEDEKRNYKSCRIVLMAVAENAQLNLYRLAKGLNRPARLPTDSDSGSATPWSAQRGLAPVATRAVFIYGR